LSIVAGAVALADRRAGAGAGLPVGAVGLIGAGGVGAGGLVAFLGHAGGLASFAMTAAGQALIAVGCITVIPEEDNRRTTILDNTLWTTHRIWPRMAFFLNNYPPAPPSQC
jgi:hypothetical protein